MLVLERTHDDPYESVCQADPSHVQLVMIGGDVCYSRADWFPTLVPGPRPATCEDVIAWGTPMTIDTGFSSPATNPTPPLSQVRSLLVEAYPPIGPIFA